MGFDFLFWLFFIGIVVATLQDLKRREVDDWLNLFLLISSFSFIFFRAIFEKDSSIIFLAVFILLIMFVLMNLFYYGRVFAGGDAKLLFSMAAFFVGASFIESLANVGIFILFLMISGSVYGIIYSLTLYFNNSKKVNKVMSGRFWCFETKLAFVIGSFLILAGFFNWIFILFGFLAFIFPFLFVFAMGIEEVVMIKIVNGKKLREGDWLVEDIHIGKRIVKADWDGLSSEDIKLLSKMKRVKIKEGLPFVPAFLIAFIFYVFLKGLFLEFFL